MPPNEALSQLPLLGRLERVMFKPRLTGTTEPLLQASWEALDRFDYSKLSPGASPASPVELRLRGGRSSRVAVNSCRHPRNDPERPQVGTGAVGGAASITEQQASIVNMGPVFRALRSIEVLRIQDPHPPRRELQASTTPRLATPFRRNSNLHALAVPRQCSDIAVEIRRSRS
jgi:hypothetical protein